MFYGLRAWLRWRFMRRPAVEVTVSEAATVHAGGMTCRVQIVRIAQAVDP